MTEGRWVIVVDGQRLTEEEAAGEVFALEELASRSGSEWVLVEEGTWVVQILSSDGDEEWRSEPAMVNTMLAQRVEVGAGGVVPVEAKMGRPSSVWGMHGDKVAPTWGGGQLRRSGRNGTTAADMVVIGRLCLRARSMFETVVTVAMGRAQILFQSFSKYSNIYQNL
jgi:hypothetical protein